MIPGRDVDVLHGWFELCHESEVGLAAASAMAETLAAAYAEPHRRYHDLGHIGHVLDLAEQCTLDPATRAVVRYALWFHDLVYDPQSSGNEIASARFAADWLNAQGAGGADHVARIIEMTAAHSSVDPSDRAAAVVHDVDLAILGELPEAYERYAAAIRAEYAWLDDATYAAGRAAVLDAMLATDPLFVTPEFAPVLEKRARANLEAELAGLR